MALSQLSLPARSFKPIPLAQKSPEQRVPIVAKLSHAPRVHLWHIGCQMNEADRDMLTEHFAEIGFIPDSPLDEADLVVLITCAIRQNSEQKVYGKFKELIPWKKVRAGRTIAMTGCMASEHGASLLDRLPALDYVFDIRSPEGFFEKMHTFYGGIGDITGSVPSSDRLSAYVPVMGGCNEMCTYCIVPFVRGRETSRTVDDIVRHVTELAGKGVREVTLLGQNVNSYKDPATQDRLWDLLAKIDEKSGIGRQRFMTSHPRNATDDLFYAMRDVPSVCEHLHLPVQAGNDALLRRMRRLYTVDEYTERAVRAQEIIPNLSLGTDIIVGFCGETEEEFLGTEKLLRDIKFDVVHIQAYSPRPGTAASRREDGIPLSEKKRRLNHLLAIQRSIVKEKNASYIGKTVEILVEGVGKNQQPYGRTRQNKVAWLPPHSARVGSLCTTTIVEANGWQLFGAQCEHKDYAV